jgi:hypothetical protein
MTTENGSKETPEKDPPAYYHEAGGGGSTSIDSSGDRDPTPPHLPLTPRQAPPHPGGRDVGKPERYIAGPFPSREADGSNRPWWSVREKTAADPWAWRELAIFESREAAERFKDAGAAPAEPAPSQAEQVRRCLQAGGHFEGCACPDFGPPIRFRRRRTGWAYLWRAALVIYACGEAGYWIGRTCAEWVTYEGDE